MRRFASLCLALALSACATQQEDPDAGLDDTDVELPVEDAGVPIDLGEKSHDASPVLDTPPIDAGSTDTGTLDAGALDTGTVDAGTVDTGTTDSGPMDAGTVDTGPMDTGPMDTGPIDTGPVDTGPTDLGPLMCPSGRADCNNDRSDGCEVDLANDPANCGACGRTGTETFNSRDDDCDGIVDEGFSSNGLDLSCSTPGVDTIPDGEIDDYGSSSGGDSLQIYCYLGSFRFCLSGEACPWRGATPPEDGRNCSSAGLSGSLYRMAYATRGYWVLRGVYLDDWFCPPTGRVRIIERATGLP
ncbi:MAG: hypothetical protein R3A52_06525 [Polyangiales bacterium]